jgi:type IV secretion system protein VirD4
MKSANPNSTRIDLNPITPINPTSLLVGLSKIDPIMVFIVIAGIAFLILNIFMAKGKQGKTATARWATDAQKSNCQKIAQRLIARPKFNNAAYYITEPIGAPVASPQNLKSSTRVFLPQVNRGLLVVGGAGAGKTANLIDPAILSAIAQGFTIALFDFKFGSGGQAETIIPAAIEQGYDVRILAPGFEISQTCNLLDRLQDDQDLASARELVSVIVENTGEDGAKKDSFFDPAGIAVLSGAFLLAKSIAKQEHNPDLANLLMVNQILNLPHLSKRLIASRDLIEPWAYTAFGVLTGSSSADGKNPTEAGILATAIKTLAPMVLPNYLPSFCGKSTFPCFDPEDPLKVDGKQLIVFGVDKNNRASTVPLIATAMHQIISYNLRPDRSQPLVIALDEFPTLNLKVVLDWLNQERFNGCSLIIGAQYLGQLIARYGQDWAKGFQASCATKIWFNPGEHDTAHHISQSLGDEELELESKSKTFNSGQHSGNSRSINNQLHKKPLIEAHVIRQFPQGACIIECPAVGDKQHAGVPYRHQFSYSETQADAFKASNAQKFAQISQVIVEHQQQLISTDYSQKLAEYNTILERLLPLSGRSESPNVGGVSEPQHIKGDLLINSFQSAGLDLSELQINPDKKYFIPPSLIKHGEADLSIENVAALIESNRASF